MDLFLNNGFLDMGSIIEQPEPFIFVIGARGIGKTYGALSYMLEHQYKFVYMRRSQNEIDLTKTEELNPFKTINRDKGYDIQGKTIIKNVIGYYDKGSGNQYATGLALATLHNVRGIDLSDINYIFYDEFIPQLSARPIKSEFDAFANCYETINRNRELSGCEPVKMICAANSNNAANPIFIGLGLVTTIEKIKNEHRSVFRIRDKGILIINVEASPISEKKKETALYKLMKNTDYAAMALENEFSSDDFTLIHPEKLAEYKPLFNCGEITIYRHKSKNQYYVSQHYSGAPDQYGTNERELKAFAQRAWRIWDSYLDGRVLFENYLCKILFTRYINS